MKKKLLGLLALLITLSMIFTAGAVFAEPAAAPAEDEAIVAESDGESAEGESADSEAVEGAADEMVDTVEAVVEEVADGESAEGESAEGESADSEATEATDAAAAEGDSADAESSGESAEGESEGDSGDSAGDDSGMGMANGQNNEDTSVVTIIDGEVAEAKEDFGTLEIAEGGVIDAATISGVRIIGSTDESNGVFIKAAASDQVTTFGGAEDYYDVEGIGSFNSVVDLYGKMDGDPGTESTYGTVLTINGGVTIIDNVYGHTEGFRAGALYTMSTTLSTSVIVKDSVLWDDGGFESWMPDAKLFPGSARATLLQATNIWFYNSGIVSRDWGSISQDGFGMGGTTSLYAVNSVSEAYKGGYTLFAHNGTNNYLYGSRMVGAEFGVYVFCASVLTMDNLAAAGEDALQYAEGVDFSETVTEDGNTLVAGGINAIAVNAMAGYGPATINIANTTLSTMDEDITSVYGTEMVFDLDSYLTDPDEYAQPWFYLANVKGAAISPRSHAANITIGEGTVIKSASGVLLQTSMEYDTMAGDLYHDSGDTTIEDPYYLVINAPVTGDVLHEDYQRDCDITVNSEYIGRTVTGSITAWNNLWAREHLEALMEENGMTGAFDLTDEAVAGIRALLVREEDTAAYTDVFGINMTVAEGGVWNVQGESSVISLTVADGATVNASEIYVDCAFGEDGYLDATTGTAVEALEAGEYSNVVLIG